MIVSCYFWMMGCLFRSQLPSHSLSLLTMGMCSGSVSMWNMYRPALCCSTQAMRLTSSSMPAMLGAGTTGARTGREGLVVPARLHGDQVHLPVAGVRVAEGADEVLKSGKLLVQEVLLVVHLCHGKVHPELMGEDVQKMVVSRSNHDSVLGAFSDVIIGHHLQNGGVNVLPNGQGELKVIVCVTATISYC